MGCNQFIMGAHTLTTRSEHWINYLVAPLLCKLHRVVFTDLKLTGYHYVRYNIKIVK